MQWNIIWASTRLYLHWGVCSPGCYLVRWLISLWRVNIFCWGRAAGGGAGNKPKHRHHWEDKARKGWHWGCALCRTLPAELGLQQSPLSLGGCKFLFSVFPLSLKESDTCELYGGFWVSNIYELCLLSWSTAASFGWVPQIILSYSEYS